MVITSLSLHHQEIPASLHATQLNPAIDFSASPFVVQQKTAPWHESAGPLRAGVSSFGIGGTNAHAIFEQAPAAMPVAERLLAQGRGHELQPRQASDDGGVQLLVLSAHTPTALRSLMQEYLMVFESADGA